MRSIRYDRPMHAVRAVVMTGAVAVLSFPLVGTAAVSSAASGLRPSAEVTARRMHPRSGFPAPPGFGTVIPARDLFGTRVFTDGQVGFALANDGQAQFPARTTDGGKRWTIDGPQLHVDAADGPEGVGYVGIVSRTVEFAYGASAVDVSTNAGRTWWEAFLGENVTAVVPIGHGLLALVQQSDSAAHPNRVTTWQYVSTDGGRHWRHSTTFVA